MRAGKNTGSPTGAPLLKNLLNVSGNQADATLTFEEKHRMRWAKAGRLINTNPLMSLFKRDFLKRGFFFN